MRYTEYHAGKAVIKKKDLLPEAIEKLAKVEDKEDAIRKVPEQGMALPVLKNNEKRREFLDGYRNWPIWFEVPEAEETYYRYNLPDGSDIVICEYKTYVEWRGRYTDEDPEGVQTREYLLKPGYHHLNDCIVSRSILVDYLKKINKKFK